MLDCPIGRWSLLTTSESGITGEPLLLPEPDQLWRLLHSLYADRNNGNAAVNVPIYAYASSYNSYSGCSWGYSSYKQQWYALLDCYRRNVDESGFLLQQQ